MQCAANIEAREVEEMYINIDPIQAAGRLTPEAQKAVMAYSDGYSVCDNCLKPFRLDYIKKPPLADFHSECAEWLGMEQLRVVPGARRGFQAVASTFVEKGDPVILTALSHYTEFVSVEQSGGIPCEIPADENQHITGENASQKIEEVVEKYGKVPSLLYVEHADYQYGNIHDIRGVAKAAHQYDIPVLLNGAYTVGTMPVNGKELGVDFIVGSGHKSMAAPAPSGVVATTDEYAEKVFRTTKVKGDVTGRTFGIKEVELMGCSLMGVTMVGLTASFPAVKKRVENWDTEIKHSRMFADTLLSIEGTKCMSDTPREHTLTRVNTIESFDKVAETHKKRGYFLSGELKKKGITGVIPGSTKVWKYNTYGLTQKQTEYLSNAFIEVAENNGLNVN
ncbi:O-phospho-L-seryl-tRNA:Cys-tRNA synthase [Methanoplanus sp. FWC-SCC4]|uniref:O-phospho-L-seryl-tRNA:Cys-tRNA synthase n=1 Tax=Methanochimaera problematica TaxID=2609417 RepID=A0AA97FDR4_9EURY|nr:O-phospho-L-seryl-tRNA:Cys-tRNA synthase [Methanoplanus sp. FWC-SCC4]WOF16398.1 O-phospho-L-seryl-tRNA:Cys-tRNA synthase [Methanoplanus sp. FWC-SCC4]